MHARQRHAALCGKRVCGQAASQDRTMPSRVFVVCAVLCGAVCAQAQPCPDAEPGALTLRALLARGLCLDPQVAQQAFEVTRTRGTIDEAAAAAAWQLSLDAGPSASVQQGSGGGTRSVTGSGSLTASRLLADGGLTRSRTAQRERESAAAAADLEAARQNALRDLAGAWSDAREAQATLLAATRALDAARLSDAAARARLAAGAATRVDALQAASALAQAERELVSANVAWRRRQVVLAERLGWPADTPLALRRDEAPWLASLSNTIGDAPPQLSADAHPQLLAQAERLQSRRAALDAARAEEGATVNVAGSTGPNLTRGNASTLTRTYDTTQRWQSQIALTWSMPLSDGGAKRSRVAQNQASVDSTLSQQAALQRSLRENLWQQWTAWRGADAELRAAQAAFDAAQANESAQRGRYQAGAGTLADWISAQSDLSSRARQAASAEQSRLRAAVGTVHALGRLGPMTSDTQP
jgi:outer membrane protein